MSISEEFTIGLFIVFILGTIIGIIIMTVNTPIIVLLTLLILVMVWFIGKITILLYNEMQEELK